MRRLAMTSLVAMLLLGGVPARAAQRALPSEVTLNEALGLLQTDSPFAAVLDAEVDMARADRKAAGVLPNPSISYGVLGLANGANTGAAWQHQVTLEQPVPIFGQIRARTRAADLGIRAAQRRAAAAMNERVAEVWRAFVDLLAEQERVRVLEAAVTDLESVAAIVRGRAAAGDRSTYDVLRLQVEVTALRLEIRQAEVAERDASGRLAVALGFPQWRPRAVATGGGAVDVDPDRLWATARNRRPALLAAQADLASARGGLDLARRERLPIPAFALGTLITRAEDSQSVFLGVSLPLPLFDRGQGGLAQARAEIAVRERALELATAQTQAELERTRDAFVAQHDALRTLEREMLSQVPALRRMGEDAYRDGEGTIMDLLDTLRVIRGIQEAYVEQRRAVGRAEAELVTVTGGAER